MHVTWAHLRIPPNAHAPARPPACTPHRVVQRILHSQGLLLLLILLLLVRLLLLLLHLVLLLLHVRRGRHALLACTCRAPCACLLLVGTCRGPIAGRRSRVVLFGPCIRASALSIALLLHRSPSVGLSLHQGLLGPHLCTLRCPLLLKLLLGLLVARRLLLLGLPLLLLCVCVCRRLCLHLLQGRTVASLRSAIRIAVCACLGYRLLADTAGLRRGPHPGGGPGALEAPGRKPGRSCAML